MPIYEYDCDACGDFTALRPMSVRSEPCDCPACGTPSPRVIRTAPGLATMAGSTRAAHETNERASHAPIQVTQVRYDTWARLVRMGIVPGQRRDSTPRAFPDGFVPDPPPRWR